MTRKVVWVALFAAGFMFSGAFAQQPSESPMQHRGPRGMMGRGPGADQLDKAMRKLWEDHIAFTRNYIISALGGLQDTDQVVQRLMKNQEEIGAAIKPYYGEDAGNKLTSLLKEHIQQAAEVVRTAKAGNKEQLDAAQKKWSANGRDIAAFLSGANPNWPRATLETMLQKHLDLTTGEVVARLKQDWAADIRSYDEGHAHMLMFADTLADGIARQFPDKVRAQVAGAR